MLIVAVAGALALYPGNVWAVTDPLGMSRRTAALAFFLLAALSEELAKAAGVAVSAPQRSRLSWFWLVIVVAGGFGALERLLMVMNYFPPPGQRMSDAVLLAISVRGVLGHVALSLLCVTIARLAGRGVPGWLLGAAAAGAAHGLLNIAPMYLRLEVERGMVSLPEMASGALFAAFIALAYLLRRRLDWRVTAPAADAPDAL